MQAAIDNSKRTYDISITDEIKRIKKDINVKENKYPAFWSKIAENNEFRRTGKQNKFNNDKINYDLVCPMNCLYNLKLPSYNPTTSTIPFKDLLIKHEFKGSRKIAVKVQKLIGNYLLDLANYNRADYSEDIDNAESFLLILNNFDTLINELKEISFSEKYMALMSVLIYRVFALKPKPEDYKTCIDKIRNNKSVMLNVLYNSNPEIFLKCFKSK